MAEDRDQPSELPTSERVASVRSQLRHLRERLEELQRLAPQPPPPLPPPAPSPPPHEMTAGAPALPAHDGGWTGTAQDGHQPMTTSIANSTVAILESGTTAIVALPTASTVVATVTPTPWSPARRARNSFQLALNLAQRPGFCCCCLCLGPRDAKRARRIFALVRAIKRAEKSERRRRR